MQREEIVKGQRNVAGDHKRAGDRDLIDRLRLEQGSDLAEIGVVKQLIKREAGPGEDRQADRCADRAAAEPGGDGLRDNACHVGVGVRR